MKRLNSYVIAIVSSRALLTLALLTLALLTCVQVQASALSELEEFVYPILDTEISSNFGKRVHPIRKVVRHHQGVDLSVPEGVPIRAIADGRIVFADPYQGYGKLVVIEHQGGITSHYGHCSKIIVSPGQKVKAGNIIGKVGSTGLATGPHLHFEIRRAGEPLDPLKVIPDLAGDGEG